ncbi:DUF6354 family protein [Streptomyces olivaceoviridis]|uniref:DUF6354 family protein n=1 Tax=Streptomyces olivaceoviridis TaxID=1921 RepID=UPI003D9EBB8C
MKEGQLYRDLDRYMDDRDRRLRVTELDPDGRALCLVEHDLGRRSGSSEGRTTRIHVRNLANPRKFELLEETDAVTADPRYARLLTAMAAVHGPAATPRDYARAAYDALGLKGGAA